MFGFYLASLFSAKRPAIIDSERCKTRVNNSKAYRGQADNPPKMNLAEISPEGMVSRNCGALKNSYPGKGIHIDKF